MRVPGGEASLDAPMHFKPTPSGPLQGPQGADLGDPSGSHAKRDIHFPPLAEARPIIVPFDGNSISASGLEKEADRASRLEELAPTRPRSPARRRQGFKLVQPGGVGSRVTGRMMPFPDVMQA